MKKYPIVVWSAFFLLLAVSCGKGDGGDKPDEPGTPEPKTVLKPGDELKVMAYNIHHANPPSVPGLIDINAIAAVINREQPDLVALQEVDVRTRRAGTSLDQAQALGARTGMQAYFIKSIDYQGGEYGNAILSRYPILDRRRHELPGAEGPETEGRSVGLIAIETAGGGRIYFASTHLDASHNESRNIQVNRLREINAQLDAPLIIGGDFNAQIGSESINRFIADGAFQVACLGGCPNTIPATSPNRAIDFIFLNQRATSEFTVLGYATVNEPYASDHRPVVATVRYQ